VGFETNVDGYMNSPIDNANRNTNVSKLTDQMSDPICYAHAAAAAYVNTCSRIAGCEAINLDEALQVANITGSKCGAPVSSALAALENHYRKGVCWKESDSITVKDIMALSVCITFYTSTEGWANLAKGLLITKPNGEAEKVPNTDKIARHACLIESYDLENDWSRVKNSWGENANNGRCSMRFSALHGGSFTTVYFTAASIQAKQPMLRYEPKLLSYSAVLKKTRHFPSSFTRRPCQFFKR